MFDIARGDVWYRTLDRITIPYSQPYIANKAFISFAFVRYNSLTLPLGYPIQELHQFPFAGE